MRCAWLLFVLALPTAGYAEVCPDRSSPELAEYVVGRLRLQTPFDFFAAWRERFASLRSRLPQQAGQRYDAALVSRGVALLTDSRGALEMGLEVGQPVNITVAFATLDNCDASSQPKSLEVVYHLFTTRSAGYTNRAVDPALTADDPVRAAGLDQQRFAFTPRLDYNRAAKTRAGAALDVRRLGIIDAVALWTTSWRACPRPIPARQP
jgi:hypothetical protein